MGAICIIALAVRTKGLGLTMTEREAMMHNVPQEWLDNRKLGLCPVCGKSDEEFEKGRKIYCSKTCAKKYAECFMSWQDYKNSLLHEPVCAMCGLTETTFKLQQNKRLKERNKMLLIKYKNEIAAHKLERLRHAEQMFLEDIKRIEDASIDDWEIKTLLNNLGESLKEDYTSRTFFEVDHIRAITNDGDMWDKKNLQVLCIDCHRKKTKQDLKVGKK